MEQKGDITKYQIIESNSIDDFIVAHMTEGVDKDDTLLGKAIELIYYLGSILYNDKTPGNDLMLISLANNKKQLAVYYIFRTLIPCLLSKYPILRLIYFLLDLKHFLGFIANVKGIGPTVFDSLLAICSHSLQHPDALNQSNALIYKRILWKEVSSLLLMLFPRRNSTFLIKTKEPSRLCQICKNLPTNAATFPCAHVYCYYCYMNHPSNKDIEQPLHCIICHQA